MCQKRLNIKHPQYNYSTLGFTQYFRHTSLRKKIFMLIYELFQVAKIQYVCICVCMYVVCTHDYIHTYTCTSMHTHTYTHIHTYIVLHRYMHAYTHKTRMPAMQRMMKHSYCLNTQGKY